MNFDEFMRRKRDGRLPRIRIPNNGYAQLGGWVLWGIVMSLAVEFCKAQGWIG